MKKILKLITKNDIFRMVTHYGLKNNHIEKVVKTFKLILNK